MNRLNPQPDPINEDDLKHVQPSPCPYCNAELDSAISPIKNAPQPSPGDISICAHCGEVLQFGPDMMMIKCPEELKKQLMDREPGFAQAVALAKIHHHFDEYLEQLESMRDNARQWLADNPTRSLSIQYNFTNKSCVIATLQDGIDQHFVSANADAMLMFGELGWLESKTEQPTVLMARLVLDSLFEKE